MSTLNLRSVYELIKKHHLEKYQNDILREIESSLSGVIKETIKRYSNKHRIIEQDEAKAHFTPTEVLSQSQIAELPSWVRDDLQNTRIVGTSQNVIQTSNGRKYHLKNKLNHLSGAEWTYFLNSVISTRYPPQGAEGYAHHIRKIHPSPKPPQLLSEIINFFTKENELVLDYFMGVGGTLLAASLTNRRAIGIDLEEKYIKAYKLAASHLGVREQIAVQGDSIELLRTQECLTKLANSEKFSLILIDPPYGDMMARRKTGEIAKKGGDTSPTPFTNLDTDLGNLAWSKFREVFRESVERSR